MDQVSQVREKIDIVAFLSEFIKLQKAGRNFRALCPFHGEKTPSFMISPERQTWHCFGCNKGGDVFSFLMQYESIDFGEALRFLAKRTGVTLNISPAERGVTAKKEILYAINMLASEFYHYILTKHPAGKTALTYLLEKRGISEKVIETFKLGFAPTSGLVLSQYLTRKKGYKQEDIIEVGLSYPRGGRLVDFFANRVMFPLFDHRDNVVGFSGRVMGDSADVSKYVNTRETLLYHKSSHFFGINIAKDSIKKEERAIVVEGEFDVISCFSEGISNVVAVKGTALTDAHVQLIARFAQKVSLCFDQDKAGQEAIKRSISSLERKGLTTTVIVPPDGKDPDEAIRQNPLSFHQAVKHDIGIYDYLLERAMATFDKDTAEGKKQVSDALLPYLALIDNAIVKEHYLRKVSTALDTSYESIVRQTEKLEKQKEQPFVKLDKPADKRNREEVLEEYVVSIFVQAENPRSVVEALWPQVSEISFLSTVSQRILSSFAPFVESRDGFDVTEFIKVLPEELLPTFDSCYLFPLPKFADQKAYMAEATLVVSELQTVKLRKKIRVLSDIIKKEEEQGLDVDQKKQTFSALLHDLQKTQQPH